MALIKCKECGKEISGTAESCPHCGYRTAHGRSVTESKTLLIQWVICAILMFVGLVLVLGNFSPLMELYNEWDNSWFYQYNDYSFMGFLSDVGEEGTLYKFVFGVAFLIGGIIDLLIIKNKADSITGNGFEAERRDMDRMYTQDGKQQQFWECASCGERNFPAVGTCQYCGATKAWSEAQKK